MMNLDYSLLLTCRFLIRAIAFVNNIRVILSFALDSYYFMNKNKTKKENKEEEEKNNKEYDEFDDKIPSN